MVPIAEASASTDSLGEPSHGRLELGKVAFDGCGHDCVRSVEVAMSEPVAHLAYPVPRNLGLICDQIYRQGFDRFTDLDQTYTDGVENESFAEFTAAQVSLDRIDGRENVLEALVIEAAQSGIAAASTDSATLGLRSLAGTRSTRAPSNSSTSC